MSQRFFRFGLIVVCASMIACEQVQTYAELAWQAVGLGEEAVPDPTKSKAPRLTPNKRQAPVANPTPVAPASTAAEATPTPPATQSDIVITRKDEQLTRPVQKKDLKSAQKPEFRVEAPVDVKKRVGGAARLILADAEFIYLDFPQHFAVYDRDLNFLARIALAFPLKEVKRVTSGDKTYLYLIEESDVLEIVELTKTVSEQGVSFALSDVISYEVGGNFTWIDDRTLLILLPDKLQFLDFSNFNDVKILNEVPLTEASSARAFGAYIYVSRNGSLDILDGKTFKLMSSLRIGKDFDFLGITGTADAPKLLLTLGKEADVLSSVQYLNLSKDFASVTDFGQVIYLEKSLKHFFVDFANGWILGQEVSEEANNPLRLFSLNEKRFLRGDLSTRTNIMAWSIQGAQVYLVTPLDISTNTISLQPDVISQAPQLEKLTQASSGQTPLAQIGAGKTLKDEYAVTPVKSIEFMADARKVALLDDNHFIVFENRELRNTHQIFTSSDFAAENFTLGEPATPEATRYDKLLSTDFGLMAFSKATKKVYFLDVNLTNVQTMPLVADDILSWTHFTDEAGEILAITTQTPAPTKKAPAPKKAAANKEGETTTPESDMIYAVDLVQLKSPQEVEVLSRLNFPEKPFVLRTLEGDLMILTASGLKFYDISDLKKPKMGEYDKFDFAAKRDVAAIKPYLVSNRVYALLQDNERLKIAVFSLLNPAEMVVLEDFDITPEQFEGASFSKGGQLFILPTSEGTLFYDMTELNKSITEDKRIVAHWPLPSEYVDVAREGRFICVALGAKGVYCGDLLFY